MKRFSLYVAVLVFGIWFLSPASASPIPLGEGCYCGPSRTLYQTIWGGAPYTCSDLAAIGYSNAQQYADSHCGDGVCSLTFANDACVDSGCSSQHYDLSFTYRCYTCN